MDKNSDKTTKKKTKPKPLTKANKGPKNEKDFELLEGYMKIHCTKEECAGLFKCSHDTLERKIKYWYGEDQTFATVRAIFASEGKLSLRRAQFKSAIHEGNVSMQKWLGQQILGQSEKLTQFDAEESFTPDPSMNPELLNEPDENN